MRGARRLQRRVHLAHGVGDDVVVHQERALLEVVEHEIEDALRGPEVVGAVGQREGARVVLDPVARLAQHVLPGHEDVVRGPGSN